MSLWDQLRALSAPEPIVLMCAGRHAGQVPLIVGFSLPMVMQAAERQGWRRATDGWLCQVCAQEAVDGPYHDDDPAGDAGSSAE